ncbi:hypothetical protein [Sphingobacterium kitahiroshimense]|uniref:hypothetical protein n=1 Tax=Sphingobacterium kitahiroshimense TaxID=470446 RepID=UPI00320ABFA4
MNIQSNLKSIQHSLLKRMAICLVILLLGLTIVNFGKLHLFTPLTFTLYVLPFMLFFSAMYTCYRMALRKGRLWFLWWLLLILFVGITYRCVKYYYYDLVPLFFKGFTTAWKPEHRTELLSRINGGRLFFVAIVAADYFAWAHFYTNALSKKVQAQLHSMSDVQLLSGHFMRRLYNIVRMQRKSVQSESLNFFQYVTDKIAKPTVLVPLKEEWHYLMLLVSYSTDRSFIVEGDELLDQAMWNRSVPTLSLMTWIENAIAYSPCDPVEPIVIRWTKVPQGMQLQIKNCIASADLQHGTGKGLQLVNRLYEQMNNQFIELEYALDDQKYFVIKLTFKS